jgi:carbon monoxide dehydrogenase subunit G
MDVAGQIEMKVPLKRTLFAIRKPENLKRLLPTNSTLVSLTPSTYAFEIIPPQKLIPATLKGEMAIAVVKPGKTLNLTAATQIPLIGEVQLTLVLNFSGNNSGSTIAYEGTVTGTRLFGIVLDQQSQNIAKRLDAGFIALRDHLERTQKYIDLRANAAQPAIA